jgi:hypothetical protein
MAVALQVVGFGRAAFDGFAEITDGRKIGSWPSSRERLDMVDSCERIIAIMSNRIFWRGSRERLTGMRLPARFASSGADMRPFFCESLQKVPDRLVNGRVEDL